MVRQLVTGAVAFGLAVAIVGATIAFAGLYDIAASTPHWGLTERVLGIVRDRSIQRQAASVVVPTTLGDPARLGHGLDHFAAHCAVCHGGPGVPKGDIGKGLYPAAPDLAVAARRLTPGEMFWVIKHGIKMTGMPAWRDHADDEIWSMVAFLQKLPSLTEQDYAKLIMGNMGHMENMNHGQGGKVDPAEHSHSK